MEVLLRLLAEARLVIVAISAIVCAAFIFTALASRQEQRRALFQLERETLARREVTAWLRATLALLVGVLAWFLGERTLPDQETSQSGTSLPVNVTIVAIARQPAPPTSPPVITAAPSPTPTPEALVPEPTPTIDLPLAILLGTPTPAPTAQATPTPQLLPTPVLLPTATPIPTATPLPTLPPLITLEPLPTPTATPAQEVPTPALVADCPNPDAQITSPQAGETVVGVIPIRGTAGFPPGSKYKIEILRPNIEGWAFLWENHNEVKGGVLMPNFNSELFPPGVYVLRLMVIDPAGQETNVRCRVPIRISR